MRWFQILNRYAPCHVLVAEVKGEIGLCGRIVAIERFTFEKGETRGGGTAPPEAAAQRRPAQSERKNRAFSAKRQAVWFETQRVSN